MNNVFRVGGAQDLMFDYRGQGRVQTGIIQYIGTPAGVTGDYNGNGVVDAADYVQWRNGGPLQNDPTNGVQPEDYGVWRRQLWQNGRWRRGRLGRCVGCARTRRLAVGFACSRPAVRGTLATRGRSGRLPKSWCLATDSAEERNGEHRA